MTLITFQDGKAVMREGQVGTEQECCCGGCGDCIQIDYEWSITDLACGVASTFSGSVRIRSVNGTPLGGEIQCYDDDDVESVDLGIFSGRKMALNYGEVCGIEGVETVLEFVCDSLSPRGGIVMSAAAGILDILELPDGICCGETLGTFSLSNEFQSLTATFSRVAAGSCNCDGYTPVTPS